MKKIVIAMLSFILLVFVVSCEDNLTEAQKSADISDYSFNYKNLESDVLYLKNLSFAIINHKKQTEEVLPFVTQDLYDDFNWWPDGRFVFFRGSIDGKLYRYSLDSKIRSKVSDISSFKYWLSADGKAVIFYTIPDYYLYDIETSSQLDIKAYLNIIENPSDDSSKTIKIRQIVWSNEKQFLVKYYSIKTNEKTWQEVKTKRIAVIEYKDGAFTTIKISNTFFDESVQYNKDSSFAILKQNGIYLLDANTQNKRLLSKKASSIPPIFSPDGMYIMYQKYIRTVNILFAEVAEYDYYVYDINAHYSHNIFPEAADVAFASFSPSGNQIVCSAYLLNQDDGTSSYNIYWMELDGSNVTLLTNPKLNTKNRKPQFRPNKIGFY